MELTFEDLSFVPLKSTSSSYDSAETAYAEPESAVFDLPSFSKDFGDHNDQVWMNATVGMMIRRKDKSSPRPLQATPAKYSSPQPQHQQQQPPLNSTLSHHQHLYPQFYRKCPGAAHRHLSNGSQPWKFYVDPRSGAGKCHHPDCTWGYVNGKDVVTDLRGYAYTSRGEPVLYLLGDGSTMKHVRLALRR